MRMHRSDGVNSPRRWGWRHATTLQLLLFAALAAGCDDATGTRTEEVRPVRVAVVRAGPTGRTLTFSGVVRPRIESTLGFRVTGKLVTRSVNVGDRVEIGQPIARLDDTDLRLVESSATAALAAAHSRRDVANDNLRRAKALLPGAIISQAAYDARRDELTAAAAAVESSEAQLRQAVNAVSYAALTADKTGIVTSVAAEPGQVVSAGQPIVTVAETAETEIAIAVPEQDTEHLAIGQRARIVLWAGPHLEAAGCIREIAAQADPSSRTYAVRIAVATPPAAMRLGMTATVALTVSERAAPLIVPLGALTESDGGTVAYVVDAVHAVVRKTSVAVDGVAEDGAQIAAGLRSGDMVVSAGVQFLRDGMRVRLLGSPRTETP
jgi:RND family efflux transporter MFP subunit